jgi:hypothetical protein
LIARIALLSPHTVLLPTEQGNDKTKSGKEIAMALDKSILEMVFSENTVEWGERNKKKIVKRIQVNGK